jgi:hypothetical protein
VAISSAPPAVAPGPTPAAISVLPPLEPSGVPRIQIDSPLDGILPAAPPTEAATSQPPAPEAIPSGRPSGAAGLATASAPPAASQPPSEPSAAPPAAGVAAPANGIPARRTGIVFIVVAVLVGVAFLLALLSQRG